LSKKMQIYLNFGVQSLVTRTSVRL
jgi:hypothetical protein